VAERDGQIQRLAQARDGQAALVAEGQAQIQELAQARDGLAAQVAERDEEIQRLKQVGDDQERLVVEMLEKIDSERNAKAKELIEQQRQTQHWLHHSNTLQQQLDERDQLIKQIEQQLAEQSYRQNLLDEEMVKAEAQIDLIKDILIREKAF
jgi:chromosome segregation ATPase